jgi:hypothetical protein
VWDPAHTWITTRHLGLAERYCALKDIVALILRQIHADGIIVEGSQQQRRHHPALAALKNLATELRLWKLN